MQMTALIVTLVQACALWTHVNLRKAKKQKIQKKEPIKALF